MHIGMNGRDALGRDRRATVGTPRGFSESSALAHASEHRARSYDQEGTMAGRTFIRSRRMRRDEEDATNTSPVRICGGSPQVAMSPVSACFGTAPAARLQDRKGRASWRRRCDQ